MTRFAGVPLFLCPALALAVLMLGAPSMAQSLPDEVGTTSSVEFYGGRSWFLDDQTIEAVAVGGQARFRVSPLLSVGPEFSWIDGPSQERNYYVTGNVWYDLRRTPRPARGVTPFVVVGAGMVSHTWTGTRRSFSSTEFAVTGGGGARIFVTPRWYVAPEVRIGWEPHVRLSVSAGYAFGR